jgi:hypothetical protein
VSGFAIALEPSRRACEPDQVTNDPIEHARSTLLARLASGEWDANWLFIRGEVGTADHR